MDKNCQAAQAAQEGWATEVALRAQAACTDQEAERKAQIEILRKLLTK